MQHKRVKYPWTILVLFFLTVSNASAGKIYKWIDEQGVTQFSTYPPLVQKKDQPVTTLRGTTGSGSSGVLQPEDLGGGWFTIENQKKRTLYFKKDRFTSMYQTNRTSWESVATGKWRLDGGVLELHYLTHRDKAKKGKTEKFYIKKVNENVLTIIAQQGNQRWQYRRDSKYTTSRKPVSRIAQELTGNWQKVGASDTLHFSSTDFVISGKRKKNIGTRIYDSVGRKFSGRWQVDDPYIELEIVLDEVFKFEERPSNVGQRWRWLIVDRTGDTLTVRDMTTHRLMKFVKTGP